MSMKGFDHSEKPIVNYHHTECFSVLQVICCWFCHNNSLINTCFQKPAGFIHQISSNKPTVH